jgi:AraC-like DNA-binding protein
MNPPPYPRLRLDRGPPWPSRGRVEATATLVFPLDRSVVRLFVGGRDERIDRASFALVPAGVRHRLEALSPVTRVLSLFVAEASIARARRQYAPHIESARFSEVLSATRVFSRTRWIDELAHRYLFEIDACGRLHTPAARFLETELAKELYFLGIERLAHKTRASMLQEEHDLVARARAHIEQSLFAPLEIRGVAKALATSESSLLRAFRRELGISPITYLRDRRLDEALSMIESGRMSIGEVALAVGYANAPAFTIAFRRRFGVVPSRARVRTVDAVKLPPEGEPRAASRRRSRRTL